MEDNPESTNRRESKTAKAAVPDGLHGCRTLGARHPGGGLWERPGGPRRGEGPVDPLNDQRIVVAKQLVQERPRLHHVHSLSWGAELS